MQTERRAYNRNKGKIRDAVENLEPGDYIRLRGITPRESLRLMGLSEEHIDKMIYESNNSEQNLYKQSGNSIVVDVLVHLFRKMFIHRGPDPGQSHSLI